MANTAVVYDRRFGDRELSFEASGALWQASLVMRDRESDSWWSIMTSDAIGGELEGTELVELPISRKATWKEWSSRHPDTLVLSIDGEEHVAENRYDRYFASDGTFRNLEVDDDRLPPKAPIYSFFLAGKPYAAPHAAFEGGRFFALPRGHKLFLYREPGASMFASSRAWLLEPLALSGVDDPQVILRLLDEPGAQSSEEVGGFDTFWYSWVAINQATELLR